MKHFNIFWKLLSLAVVLIAASPGAIAQPLSGTYTIGGTSPNYATLGAAIADLNTKGVSGPVTFNLRNGTYNEKVLINSVSGASNTNRITIKSETNNAANVTLSASGTAYNDNYIIGLNNANYISIKHLTLENNSSSYSACVNLGGSSSFDSVLNCSLVMPTGSTNYTYSAGICGSYNGSYYAGSNVVVQNNTIAGGATPICFYTASSSPSTTNHIVENNTCTNYYYTAIVLYGVGNIKVRNNTFTTSSAYTYNYGVWLYYAFNGTEFSGNTVTSPFYYGIYIYEGKGNSNPSSWCKIQNNTFDFTATTNSVYGIMDYYAEYWQITGNTFNTTTTSGSQNFTYIYQAHNSNISNNTFNVNSTSGSLYGNHYYNNGLTFSKNTVNANCTGSGTVYGVNQLNTSGISGGVYEDNKINVSSGSGSVYGLYQSIPNGSFKNNAIRTSTSGSNYSLYASNPGGCNFYNNTVHSAATGTTNYVGYFSSASAATRIMNNVFSKTATSGYPLYLSSSTNVTSEYNNLYPGAGTDVARRGSTNYASIAAWRAAGHDLNSLSFDPGYTSATNLAPDPANSASWSLNGRGVQIAGNSTDINGAARSTTLTAGVPDLGAYEFTPTATPPAAVATPAIPTAGTTQIFTFGQDTIASLVWPAASTVPSSITVRQYTGTNPPAINTISTNKMFFYTDISVPAGTYAHTSNIYYKDPWMGSVAGENALRLAKKDGANPWVAYSAPTSTVNINTNVISTTGQTVFGLHSGIDAGDNASAAEVASPAKPFCAGVQMVSAKVRNTGNNVLTSVQVNWSVDGITQTPVSYTTSINTLGSGLGNEAIVSLGNVTFANTPRVIKIWTSSPNGVADLYNTDDTVQATLRSSLSGVYTIGGTTPNYPSITAAIADLDAYGVCGPVTFNIRNGSYTTAQYTLKPVLGASAINRITFQSESGVASNVTVSYAVTSSASNYVFLLDSAAYFTFRNLTVNSSSSSMGYAFEFRNTASYDSIIGCRMIQVSTTSSSSGGVYAYQTFKGNDVVVQGCTITNGYYGLYLYGKSSDRSTGFVLDGNTFSGQYQYPVYGYYTNGLTISNNTINGPGASSSWYGLYLYYCDNGSKIIGNTIAASGSKSYLYGGYIYYSTNDPSDPGIIRGNTWNLTNTNGSGYIYPLYTVYLTHDSVTYNTWNTNSSYYTYDYNQYPSDMYYANNNVNFTTSYYNYSYWYWSGKNNNIVENNTFNFTSSNYLYWYQYYWQNSIFRNNTVNLSGNNSCQPYLYGHSSVTYENNTINANGNSTVYGAYIYGSGTSYMNNKFAGNKIKAVSASGTAYGIYGQTPYDYTIANNVISAQGNSNTAVYFNSPNQVKLYNNALINKGASSYVLNASNAGTSFIDVRNNVIYNGGNGSGINYSSFAPANLISDYNNVFVGGTNKFNTSATLQAWRTASGQDLNSLMYDPGFTNPGSNDYSPDAANPSSWSLNGRGVHINGNDKDINGNTRVTTTAAGVPDIGPYEFLPTSTPPSATPNVAAAAGTQQVFTFGQDTVVAIDWGASATIPSSIDVKQYTGTVPPSFVAGNYPYFYTDIITPSGSYAHATSLYYKEPWSGTLAGESGFRLVKKDGANAWQVFGSPASTTNPLRNINTTTSLADFGYHTLSDVANNAAVAELVSPNAYFCAPSTLPIKVKILNNGNNVLNNVKIGWTANGLAQTTLNYNTPIGIAGSAQGNEAIVTVGNYTFPNSNPVQFVFYTFSPNGQNDPAKADDTLKVTVKPGLNGVYTVGGTSPDYATIPDAIADVNQFGICGNVVFNIRDGAYTDGGVINGPIQGGSATSRVTFQSESGVAANVVITTAKPSVFDLKDVSYVTVKNVKMVNTSTTAGAIILLKGNASNDSVVGCIMQGPSTTSSSQTLAVISAGSFSGDSTVFLKNTIQNGSAAIYLSGGTNVVFDSNTVSSGGYYTAYVQSTNGLKFRGNNHTHTYATTSYAMYFYNINPQGNNAPEFSGNTLTTLSYYSPVYMYSFNGNAANRAKISNNTIIASTTTYYYYNYFAYYCSYIDAFNNDITLTSSSPSYWSQNNFGYNSSNSKFYNNKMTINAAGYVYGWYPSYTSNCKFYNNVVNATGGTNGTSYALYAVGISNDSMYNNTFNLNSGSSSSSAAYFNFSGGNMVCNNIISNKAGGPVMSNTAAGSSNTMDYNNLYTTSSTAFVTGATAATLQAWRTASGYDKNSLCYDPGFISNTDLHPDPANPASWSLNGRGIHIPGNNVDFDGNPRVTALAAGVPDIGAFEFTPTSIPPMATAIPATPTAGVPQTFLFGQDTVARITWAPNSVVPNTIEVRQYTGMAAPTFPAPGYLYFYTDINTANVTYNFTTDIYYKDPWRGTTGTEGNLRMIRKNGIWDAFNGSLSSTDVNRNIFRAASLNSTGWFTGIDDNTLFSAIVTAATTPVICAGGGVVLNANTGIGYTYQWLFNGLPISQANGPSYTATQAGDYQVQITNSGNVTATSIPLSVVVVAAPSANVAASGPLTYCPGGVLNLNANTGVGLGYQWALNGTNIPGATNATYPVAVAGNYTVTVSNIGCATTSAVIPVNAGPLNVQLGSDTAFCQSKTTPLVLNAGYPGAKYTWNTNDTGQTINIFDRSGTYWVRVDAGPNCVDEDTIVVNVSPLPSVVGINYGHTGSTFQFSAAGAQNVKRYLWIFGNTYQDTAQVATFTYNGWTAMEVKLVVFNDCGSDTSYLQLPLNINSSSAKEVIFNLYPNPAVSEITLSAEGDISFGEITILNGLGQVVYRGDANNNSSHMINVNSLANGRYLIRANTSDGMVISKPFNVVR